MTKILLKVVLPKLPASPAHPARDMIRQFKNLFKMHTDYSNLPFKQDFLNALEESGSVSKACKIVGVERHRLYEYIKRNPDFQAEVMEMKMRGMEGLEDEAIRRARDGEESDVYHNGQKVGVRNTKSDLLTIFMLKGAFPDKYKDRVDNTMTIKDGDLAERMRLARERVKQESTLALGESGQQEG